MRHLKKFLCLALLLATSLPGAAKERLSGAAQLAKAVKGRIPGTAVNCISLQSIRSSTVIDRTAILYDTGSTLYVNVPASGLEFLDSDDVLVVRTSIDQICNLDIVELYDVATQTPDGSVGLGKFVPYPKPRTTR